MLLKTGKDYEEINHSHNILENYEHWRPQMERYKTSMGIYGQIE